MSSTHAIDTVVLDVDGTLVDSVYEHAVAWGRAFHDVGLTVSSRAVHGAIGMGAEQLVAHVAGDAVERAVGDKVREIHATEFERLGARVRLLPGADRLISELKDRGHLVVIASSGSESDTARALDHVPDTALADAVVTGDDVDRGKPAPDLVQRSVGLVEGTRAAVIGDSPWDAMAARAGGHLAVGVLTGGFTERELTDAGADLVFDSVADLLDRIDQTPLASADL